MNKKPTELTRDAIKQIFQTEKVVGIVQILSIEENDPKIYRVTISDGHAKQSVLFTDEEFDKKFRSGF